MPRFDDNYKEFRRGYMAAGGRDTDEQCDDVTEFFQSNEGDLAIAAKSGLTWRDLGWTFYKARSSSMSTSWDRGHWDVDLDAAFERLARAARTHGAC